ARALVAEGAVPARHARVGTRGEPVPEPEFVRALLDAKSLLRGPDTGQLSWAGADLVSCLARHAARVGAVHIKDYRQEVAAAIRSEEHTSELQSRENLVCRLLLEKKKKTSTAH